MADEVKAEGSAARGVWGDVRASFAALATSFRSPDLARVIGAYVGFTITEWAAFIALIVYAYRDGGSVMVGLVSLLQMIPAALIAPVAAVLGDRHRRERVLLLGYGLLTGTIGVAAVALLTDAPSPLVYLSGTAAGWTMTLIRPAHASLLPRLARTPEELSSAYAASALLESASALAGPLLAGGLMALAGGSISGPGLVDAGLALLLIGGTTAVATVRTRTDPANETAERGLRVVASQAAEGVRAVTRDRRALLLTSMMGFALVELGFVDVLIVVLAFDVIGTGEAGVGFLTAAIGVGAVVGATVALGLALRWRASSAYRWGATVGGLSIAGIAAQPALAGGFLALSGAGSALADVNGRIMLQRLMPDKQLSRTFGVLESLYMAGEGIGTFVASLLIVAVGARWTLLVAGLMLPIVVLLARRRLAALDVGARVPSAEIALLRGTSIFAPLPVPMLERLARNLVPLALPERSVVIRQGEVGDRFYTIVEGSVRIEADGGAVGTLGRGESFGEIALLRDVPRTATITAATDLRLLALDRDEFLRAVTGHEPASAAAHDLATGRLDDLEARRER